MRRASWTALGLVAAALAVTAGGCSSTQTAPAAPTGDPLVGGGPPMPPPNPAASAANSASRPPDATLTSNGGVPPLPSPTPPGSTAALASGAGVRSLDPSRDLRIGAGGPAPPSGTTPVSLMQPQPVGAAAPAPSTPTPTTPAPVIPASGQRAVSPFEDARAQLLSRGVVWMRLDTSIENGESKFVCSIPNRQNPSLRRTYEAVARDELAAIRAVLEKIDKEP